MRAREKNDITQWFRFFLVGIIETAKNSIQKFDSILKLRKKVDEKLQSLGSKGENAIIMTRLYQQPIIDAAEAKERTNLSIPSVYKLLKDMSNLGIINQITGAKRGAAIYV